MFEVGRAVSLWLVLREHMVQSRNSEKFCVLRWSRGVEGSGEIGAGEGRSVRTRRQWVPLINSSQEHSVITLACWEDNSSDWQTARGA